MIDDGLRTYTWDAEDRLLGASFKGTGNGSTFRYDGLGRRLSIRNIQGVETRYLWCGDRICQSRNSSDGVINRYFVEGIVPPGSLGFVYGVDQLGTVRDQIPLQGSGAAAFDYDPYGKLTAQSGSSVSEMSYAGLFYDANSGLYLANYRAYDPQSARWVSKDPIRENGGLNVYSYVGGNPLSLVDPLGLAGGPPVRGAYYPRGQMPRPPAMTRVETQQQLLKDISDYLDPNSEDFGKPVPGWPKTPKPICRLVCPSDTPNSCTAPPPTGIPKMSLTREMCTEVCSDYGISSR